MADLTGLGPLLGAPFSQAQELPYLAAFVAIFLGFGRSVVGLAEGMFGIADSFLNQVQRLCHTQSFIDGRLLPLDCGAARSHSPGLSIGILTVARELLDCKKGKLPRFPFFIYL